MKKILGLLLVVMMLVVAFAGCAKTVDAPATDAPADKPAEAPADKPADDAAEAPAADDKITLAFVATGISPFNDPMYPAMEQFRQDYPNVTIEEYANAEGTYEGWAQLIDALIARKDEIDGIITALFAGDAYRMKSLEVQEAGIYLCGIGNPSVPDSGMPFSWCTDVGTAAYDGAIQLCEALGGKGNVIHLAGNANDTNTEARCAGVEKACAEYPEITLIQTISDVDNVELAQNAVNNVLASDTVVNGFIATGGGSSIGMSQALTQHNDKSIKAVACDIDDPTVEAINAGYVEGTMGQNAYKMTYLAALTLVKYVEGYTYKFPDEVYQDTGCPFITAEATGDISKLMAESTAEGVANIDSVLVAP